jgi:hypothetical protein
LLQFERVYGNEEIPLAWVGDKVSDEEAFRLYLASEVRARLHDEEERARLEADLLALAKSDMATETLKALLSAVPDREPWEVGEALAECVLADQGARWPSHTDRDKRTPKASLPGADIVGFIGDGADARLAIGEVKTSAHADAPPSVMIGRSGMIHQLDELAGRVDVHRCLVQWLGSRCRGTPLHSVYQVAVRRYLESGGKDITLFGLLIRDTAPNELDLKNRAQALRQSIGTPTCVRLVALYLPCPIDQLVDLVGRAG